MPYMYRCRYIKEIKHPTDRISFAIEKSLRERRKGQRLTSNQISWINHQLEHQKQTRTEIMQKFEISESTLKRITKYPWIQFESIDTNQIQTFSECWSSDKLMKCIKLYLESTKYSFTWYDLREHISRSLDIELKPHIIRKLLKEKFRRQYKRGSGRPWKLDFKRHRWTNAYFWAKLLSILPSLKMIVNIDGWWFSRSTKQCYSWLPKGISSRIHNGKYTGSMSLLSAISTNGTSFTAVYRWTVNIKVFCHYLESLFQYINRKEEGLLPKTLILMDNCPYQKSNQVKNLMRDWKANWVYLPPYSPELAPIELLFRSLKAKLRAHSGVEEVSISSQRGFEAVYMAFKRIRPKEVINYWRQFFDQIKSIIKFIYQNK